MITAAGLDDLAAAAGASGERGALDRRRAGLVSSRARARSGEPDPAWAGASEQLDLAANVVNPLDLRARAGVGPVVPSSVKRPINPMDVLRSLTHDLMLIGDERERVLGRRRENPLDERRAEPGLVAMTVPTGPVGPSNPLPERRTRAPEVHVPARPAPPNALDQRRSGPAHGPAAPSSGAGPPNPLDAVGD